MNFSEPVLNAGVATNYELRRAGTDGLLLASDAVITPTSVSYSGNTATLTVVSAGDRLEATLAEPVKEVTASASWPLTTAFLERTLRS